jgi:hypothetical protein
MWLSLALDVALEYQGTRATEDEPDEEGGDPWKKAL